MLREHVTADLAGERLHAAVRLQVDPQVAGRLEALATDAAAVRLVHSVALLVLPQLRDGAEPAAAARTRAGNGRGVRLEVLA